MRKPTDTDAKQAASEHAKFHVPIQNAAATSNSGAETTHSTTYNAATSNINKNLSISEQTELI